MTNLSDKVAIAAAQNIKERDFWLDNLAGELKRSFFPYDFDEDQRKMETLDCELPGDTGAGLLELSNGVDVKLHMILIAVLNILLNKYTYEGHDDILVGSPALKQKSEKEFINTFLVFRNRLLPRLTFKQLLLQVRETIVAATRHQNYPLLLLDFPLFDAALLVENIHDKDYLAGVHYDILFSFNRTPGSIKTRLEYNAARYRPGTVQQVFNRFTRVLEQVLADLDTPIAALDILTDDDKKRFLALNAAAVEYPKEKTLHQLFEEQVQRTPDRIALIAHFNGHKSYKTHMTYNQLDREANHLARQLPNAITGLLLEPSVEMFIGILGILKAGGAYLPIEPDYPQERIDFMLADSGAQLLLTAESDIFKTDSRTPHPVTRNSQPATSLAYIIYTSGSTGKPKGVAVEHRNVVANIHSFYREFELTSRDTVIQLTSYAFDAFIEEVFPLLLKGGKVVIPGGRELMDILDIAVFIARHCVTFIDTTPLLLNELNQLDSADLDLLKTVHTFISGGDVLKPGYVDRLASVGTVYNTYGPTEATVCASYYRYFPEAGVVSIPIGKPIANYGIYIMGSAGNLLPPGVPGELCITGPGVTRGYLNRPDLTNQKFLEVQEPFLKKVLGRRRHCLLYRTGDLGRWLNSGSIEFLGRVDNQVKIRGFRIELGEIESRLVSHPRVEAAVVIAKGADEGEQYLCAYIVSAEVPGKAELKEYLGRVLPHYMVPTFFVTLERLPLMPNGKLDKAALPEVEIDGGARDAAPRDHTEKQLAAIWAETLKVENIGIDSDFFDLGGSSLKAIGMISRVHRQMNVKLPLTEVFRVPTIRALARLITDSAREDYAAIASAPSMEHYPLSSAQKRLYILQQLEPELTVYNIPNVFTMFTDGGETDKERLEDTFKKLIRRHESLRTSFIMYNNEPVQRIHDHVEFKIEHSTFQSFIQPFDLSHAPLLRVGLSPLEENKYLLMIDVHHIVSDGISHDILVKDFFAIYNGEELPVLPLRYRDYSVWQHSEAQQETLKQQELFWLEQLAGDSPLLELPIDRPRPEIRQFEGSVTGFTIGEAETGALKALARREDVTLHMLMLAVFYVWLSKLGRLEDIIIGIPTAGRRHIDLENIIGVFINTLAVRSRPTGEKEFTVFLREVKQALLKAYENQEYPFEDLVERLAVRRDAGRNPIFDVIFMLEEIETQEQEADAGAGPGLRLELFDFESRIAKFDISFSGLATGTGLEFLVEYSTVLFKAETIERFTGYFKKIAAVIIDDPHTPLSDIEIISDAEKTQILQTFNDARADYPLDKTIHQLFEEQTQRTPDSIALTAHMTYNQLNRASDRCASSLVSKGVLPGTIVALMIERSVEMMVGILGILKAGGAYLPIDPDYPRDRIDYILADSSAQLLLSAKSEIFRPGSRTPYPVTRNSQPATSLAYIIYTSGSTGKPKGVAVEHGSVVNLLFTLSRRYPLEPEDACLLKTSFLFDVSVSELFGWFMAGGRLAILEPGGEKDPAAIIDTVEQAGVTHINFVPSMFYVFLDSLDGDNIGKLSRLKYIFLAGEALLPAVVEKFRALNTRITLENLYGPTEGTVYASGYSLSQWCEGPVLIGGPLSNMNLFILGPYNHLQPVGVPGELCISGSGVARGYLNNPELTEANFYRSYKSYRTYKTGDLARWLPDGNIEFLGRIDRQVKIRGFRVELEEIENHLLRHPGVKEAVVVDREREDQTGEHYLCAYIVGTFENTTETLKDFLAETLPGYMLPSHVVSLDSIPLTSGGKTDRRALPPPGTSAPANQYAPPGNRTETLIADIWKKMLNRDSVGIHDNIFELGGTSLDIIRIAGQLKEIFQKNIPVVTMFRYTTVRQMAQYIDRLDQGEEPPGIAGFSEENVTATLQRSKQDRLQQLKRRRGVTNG